MDKKAVSAAKKIVDDAKALRARADDFQRKASALPEGSVERGEAERVATLAKEEASSAMWSMERAFKSAALHDPRVACTHW